MTSGCWMHTAVPCGLPSTNCSTSPGHRCIGEWTNRSGLPETSSAPRSAMTPPAHLIPTCTRIASCSTPRLMQPKIVGRRYPITKCFRCGSLPKMSITTNSPATCGNSAMRLKTRRAVILKSKACQVNCNRVSPNATKKLMPASNGC